MRFSDTAALDELAEPNRRFPVVVKTVTTHVIWIDAETQNDANEWARRDSDLHEEFKPDTVTAAWWEVVGNPDPWELESDTFGPKRLGPLPKCPDCQVVAYSIDWHGHRDDCPRSVPMPAGR